MKIKLSDSEIKSFAEDIYRVLEDVPLYYVYEILELANEHRQKEGENPDLDITSSEEEDAESSSSEEEEENEEG
jgi:hypothetical protein